MGVELKIMCNDEDLVIRSRVLLMRLVFDLS